MGKHAHPKWTVSRVLFRPPVTRRAGEDHSSRRRIAAPLERSDPDAGCRVLRRSDFERVALNSIPIRACSGRGLPRRRSPGSRAWALTPRFQPCLCLHSGSLSQPALHRPSAVWFLLRFPSSHPGSPLATSLPFGARTFLPRSDFSAGDPPSASGRQSVVNPGSCARAAGPRQVP